MKSPNSPLQKLTRASHETLNTIHQILGRIVSILFTLHATFYLNFFVRASLLSKRIRNRDVILGLISIACFSVIGTTALSFLRKWSYRIFYGTHVTLATVLLPLLYFHVSHLRPYIWETFAIYLANLILRLTATRNHTGSLTLVSSTNLLRVSVRLSPTSKGRKWAPGQHVYLSLPEASSASVNPALKPLSARLRTNPFTIASLPSHDSELLLIARVLNGQTLRLAQLAPSQELKLKIEGPYGSSTHFPDFSRFERVLLVAGGVGATFIVPVWRSLIALRNGQLTSPDIRLVWSVRSAAETKWAKQALSASAMSDADEATKGAVEIYVTGGGGGTSNVDLAFKSDEAESIEMTEREGLMSGEETEDDRASGLAPEVHIRHGRPGLGEIVEDTFATSLGRVAVLMCGPAKMSWQLRREVGKHVYRGREVYWHAEVFGL